MADSQTTTADSQLRPTSTFHLFSKLPIELRLKIWSLTIEPRAVSLQPRGGPPPVVVAACSESRDATRHLYSLSFLIPKPTLFPGNRPKNFSKGVPKESAPNARQRAVFINYDIDVLNISGFKTQDGHSAAVIFFALQQAYPLCIHKTKSIMVGVPRKYQGWRGFLEWWRAPWNIIDVWYWECETLTLVFGGHEWMRLGQLVDLRDGTRATEDEKRSMEIVRTSLARASDGVCTGLEVRFARIE